MKKKNKLKIDIITDNNLVIPEYIIDSKNKSKKTIELIEHYIELKNLDEQKKEAKIINLNIKKKFKKKTYRKKSFFRKAK